MVTLINEIITHVNPGDLICIEGFPYDTQRAMFAGGLHHGIRNELYKRKLPYYEVAPNAVKKFVGVTGWTGEKGNKVRLTGPQKKRAVMKAVEEHFGFIHKSDNVVDAYIMAQISMQLEWYKNKNEVALMDTTVYQEEVLQSILESPKKKAKA
jgi:crossover junction endodeoxyribonuclease RuvC